MSMDQAQAKLNELIKGIRIAQFTTIEDDGSLRSRPMATQDTEFDGVLWFFTRDDSAKVRELRSDEHVNVGYSHPDNNRFVSVSGRAEIVRDRAKIKELWTPPLKAWFPDGEDDAHIALIKVTVDHAEFWDAPNSTMVKIAGFVKAVLTGQTYQPGENKSIDLKTGETKDQKVA
jgi:general stress protein 26